MTHLRLAGSFTAETDIPCEGIFSDSLRSPGQTRLFRPATVTGRTRSRKYTGPVGQWPCVEQKNATHADGRALWRLSTRWTTRARCGVTRDIHLFLVEATESNLYK